MRNNILLALIWLGILSAFIPWTRANQQLSFNLQPPTEVKEWIIFDLDKFAKGVARAETGDCTKGYGLSHNNCFGIMTWASGTRKPKWYNSPSESYGDFKRIWVTHYGGLPDEEEAKRWTGGDRWQTWLTNTTNFYFQS